MESNEGSSPWFADAGQKSWFDYARREPARNGHWHNYYHIRFVRRRTSPPTASAGSRRLGENSTAPAKDRCPQQLPRRLLRGVARRYRESHICLWGDGQVLPQI